MVNILREVCIVGAAALLFALVLPAALAQPNQDVWYRNALTGMEVGPTGAQFGHSDRKDTRYCSRFDGKAIVQKAISAGVDYLVLWVRDGDYAYYTSKLLPVAPGLGTRDPLHDAVSEAHSHHLPLLAYCVVQQGGLYLDAHPEYEMRGADGDRIGRFCYNSGYLEAMKGIVAEQLAYGIDGFHIDMVDQGFGKPYGCYCDTCKKLFRKQYGHDMPSSADWDSRWDQMLEFRYATSERFEKQLYAYIKSVNPKATVDFNYHGNPPFSFEVGQRPVQHAGNADFVTGETGQWGFSALGVGLNAEFYRASTPGIPYQVAMQRGVRMYHDQTTRPLADIEWELNVLLSHGAFVTMVDKTGFEGDLDPIAYGRIGRAFKAAHACRADFGQQPLYDVGILFSSRTRDWVAREHPASYFQAFEGAAKMCAYEHLTYGVLLDENLSLEAMKRFPVVCVPGAAILSKYEVELFKQYVMQGGNLIITGETGLRDHYGAESLSSSIEGLVGAKPISILKSKDNWVRLSSDTPGALSRNIPSNWNFLVVGPGVIYSPTSAKPLATLLQPSRTTLQREGKDTSDWPMSPDKSVGPAALINKIGKGSVFTFACSPDYATASDHHITETRRLLRNAVHLLNPHPRVTVTAPANVETVVTDDPTTRTVRVHFIAYNALPQTTASATRPYSLPGLMEEAPIYRAEIRTAFKVTSVVARRHAKVTSAHDNSGSTVHLLAEDVHEVIVIRY